jgi:cell division GTPase FtsZ
MTDRRQFIIAVGGLFTTSWIGSRALAAGSAVGSTPTGQIEKGNTAAVVRVLGVGSAGCNIVEQMRRDTNFGRDRTFLVGRAMETRELDVRLDSGVDGELSNVDAAVIRHAVQGADTVFVIAGLGAKTGTQIAPLVAQAAKAVGAAVVAVVIEPFNFEGGRMRRAAERGLRALASTADRVIRFSNQERVERAADDVNLAEFYAQFNDEIALVLRDEIGALANRS